MKSDLLLLPLLFLLLLLVVGAAAEQKSPKLEKEEQFRDFFLLTRDNFSQAVEHSRMAWVVFFHNGMLQRSWKTSAAGLRGVVRFGMIHRGQEVPLLRALKIANGTVARVYPHGGLEVKKKFAEDCGSGVDAVSKAERSIPDRIPELEPAGLGGFLMDSFSTSPTRLPLLMLTRESSPSPAFRALALRFERYFSFRLVRDPSPAKMRRLGLPADFPYHVPGLVLLVLEHFAEPARRNFFAVQFDKAKMGGGLTYSSGLLFLLQMNGRFRHTLPPHNAADDPATLRADDVLREERQVFDIRDEVLRMDPTSRSSAPLRPRREL